MIVGQPCLRMRLPINGLSSVSRYSNNVSKSPVSLDPCSNAKKSRFSVDCKVSHDRIVSGYFITLNEMVSTAGKEERINKAGFTIDSRNMAS